MLGSVLDIRSGVLTCGCLFYVCYLCVGETCLSCGWFIYGVGVVVLGIAWLCC